MKSQYKKWSERGSLVWSCNLQHLHFHQWNNLKNHSSFALPLCRNLGEQSMSPTCYKHQAKWCHTCLEIGSKVFCWGWSALVDHPEWRSWWRRNSWWMGHWNIRRWEYNLGAITVSIIYHETVGRKRKQRRVSKVMFKSVGGRGVHW